MRIVNSDLDKKQITKQVISVADAVGMNAAPEYWLSFKLAGVQFLGILSVAKLFIQHKELNPLTNN